MKLYLDQMLRIEVAEELRRVGHDAVRAAEVGHARADDAEILEYAIREDRVLITLDKHFGDWAVLPLRNHPGVIRLKVHPTTAANALALLVPFLLAHEEVQFRNRLVIVSPNVERWIRMNDD